MRKVLKTKGAFPNQDAFLKLAYLVIQNISKKLESPDAKLEYGAFALVYNVW